jgi:alkyl hydroperoxide reductase subunit AhpF
MVELVNFDSDKFSSEFVQDEIISLGAVTVIENEGTTEVNSVGIEIRHRGKEIWHLV